MEEHIDDILNSDLLERFVRREASPEERLKVDLLRVDNSVVRDKLKKIEMSIKKGSDARSSKASGESKECIMKSINESSIASQSSSASANNSMTIPPIIKYAAAILIGGLATWLLMQNKIATANDLLAEQEADMIVLENDYDLLNKQYDFLNHTATLPYVLDGKAFSKNSQVVIYWNQQLEKSMLRVVELPAISADQTYQLWADVEGKMLSLGTFDAGEAITDAIPMNYLSNAASLNITVEPTGGSEHPNVSSLTASITI